MRLVGFEGMRMCKEYSYHFWEVGPGLWGSSFEYRG